MNDVLHVVRHIHSDDYFAKKVVGQHADKVFHTNYEELLIGARQAHRRRNPW